MINAQDYWIDKIGRHLMPSSQFEQAIMGQHPHAVEGKKPTRMGSSEPARFLACEDFARVWSPIREPETAKTTGVEFYKTSDRKRRDWIIDLITSPPPAPFLAATLGLSFGDTSNWRLTCHQDTICIGGNEKFLENGFPRPVLIVDRPRFLDAAAWFSETGANPKDLVVYSYIVNDFGLGNITADAAKNRIDKLKTDVDLLRNFPGPRDPDIIRLIYDISKRDTEEGV